MLPMLPMLQPILMLPMLPMLQTLLILPTPTSGTGWKKTKMGEFYLL